MLTAHSLLEVSTYSVGFSLQLVPLGLFELHCDEAVRTLVKRASDITAQLLARMAQDNQRLNQQ